MKSAVWAGVGSGLEASAGAASHAGRRENNEDFVHIDPECPFALVLDGMGGQAAGELASQKGAEAVRESLCRGLKSGEPPGAVIRAALRAGNEAVLELGRSDGRFHGCGTTVVLALWHGGAVHVAWLGDSAAFRASAGRIEKLTWDHNLTNVLLKNGVISPAEARDQGASNVLLRFLGSEELSDRADTPSFAPRHGDRLVLATDGVTGVLSEADILRACRSHPDPRHCAKKLVRLALARGSRDNCTCAVIAFERRGGAAPARPARKWWQFWR